MLECCIAQPHTLQKRPFVGIYPSVSQRAVEANWAVPTPSFAPLLLAGTRYGFAFPGCSRLCPHPSSPPALPTSSFPAHIFFLPCPHLLPSLPPQAPARCPTDHRHLLQNHRCDTRGFFWLQCHTSVGGHT